MQKIHWILRVAASFCFLGHGAFGIITKTEWLHYFFLANIPPAVAYRLMPAIGTFDILMAGAILVYPCAAVLIWMAFWALFTALLRPMSGEMAWEALERAGNYGVPLALLILSGWFEGKLRIFKKIKPAPVSSSSVELAKTVLAAATTLLLAGHGAFLALMKKDIFAYQLLQTGIQFPREYLVWVGVFEIGMGLAVFVWRPFKLLLFIIFWKVLTELFYPLSGFPVWEFIERGGSYGAPLALYFLLKGPRGLSPAVPAAAR